MDKTPKLVITSPADAVAVIPYLLGFHPDNSLVILCWNTQSNFAARLDLVDREHYSDLLMQVLGMVIRNAADAAILLGYGGKDLALPLLAEVKDALEDVLTVKEVLHVDGGRWRSLVCHNRDCCPEEGTPYDITTSKVAAQATYAGLVAYGSRQDKAATLTPVEGQDRVWMVAETERAEADLLREGSSSDLLVREGLPMVRSLIGQDRRLTDQEAARLSVVLTHLRVRDEAWIRIAGHDPMQQLRLWQDVTRRAVEAYAAAPAALLAYTAYLSGDGGLAQMALARCRQASPSYALAWLLQQCLDYAVPPKVIRERFSLTPEALAQAWGDSTEAT
ncbi:protein of unknown function [Thermomonospora echinospora]|uniref:DUF4192 domain-containing protein n=1 Tax=Thermomonospora echinospora TaxID=1992 RepID=A0A1H6AL20_9ACTN|nr:DUF4192 domain-containing protein [Thermomonospora echinospora]SEG48930.1 protein of unknown function [Thermomonospora echinospora]